MTELNLTANDERQQTVLQHLITMVSDTLAEKINNGVYIEKDGKRLLNKKDLNTFMNYATEQAKNTIAEQQRRGAQAVCVHGDDIMSWAIHYFEEDSIEGTLYNEDGTEYKPIIAKPKIQQTTQPQVIKKQNNQASIFDLMEEKPPHNESDEQQNNSIEDVNDDYPQPSADEVQEILAELDEEDRQAKPPIPDWYLHYVDIQKQFPTDIVAYRLGDFYEVFGDKAVAIADELSLTLTSRDCHLESRVPMIGFPYHAADNYFNRICKNHALVIVESKDKLRRLPRQLLDIETGEITDDIPQPNTHIDEQLLATLSDILGDVFIVR